MPIRCSNCPKARCSISRGSSDGCDCKFGRRYVQITLGIVPPTLLDVVTIWNDDIAPYLSEQKREEVYQRELKSLKIRNDLFRHNAPPIDLSKFSSVILVDDGMATGATMRSAIESIRHQSPKTHIICAIPVSSDSAMDKIKPSETKKGQDIADEVICLDVPPMFWGVGGFYDDFTQVHEDIVVSMLQKSQKYHSQNK